MNLCVCVCVCLTFLMCLDNTDLISPGHLEAAVKQITEIYNAASAAWLAFLMYPDRNYKPQYLGIGT